LVDRVKEALDVGIEYPVHWGAADRNRQCIQRIMLPPFGPKPVREAEEVFLVDGVEHRNGGALDDFVFQCSYSQRALSAVRFGDEDPCDGQRPVCAATLWIRLCKS
jgi:hypothetical protein